MRRDCVTQVIVEWPNGEFENFATPFEAERFINIELDELGEPSAACTATKSGTIRSLRMKRAGCAYLTDFPEQSEDQTNSTRIGR